MNEEDLILWWQELETVAPYGMTPEPLPGDVIGVFEPEMGDLFVELEDRGECYSMHLFADDDSFLNSPTGVVYKHKGFVEEEE